MKHSLPKPMPSVIGRTAGTKVATGASREARKSITTANHAEAASAASGLSRAKAGGMTPR